MHNPKIEVNKIFERSASRVQYVLTTVGADEIIGAELRAVVREDWAIENAAELLRAAEAELKVALPGTTQSVIWWGFRQVTWIRRERLVVGHEFDSVRTLREGVQGVVGAYAAQHWVCERYLAPFSPAHDDQLVATSRAALAGAPEVEGTRYELGSRQTGWVIIDREFQGGPDDLVQLHAWEFVAARPELERFFGLPIGWRFFRAAEGESVNALGEAKGT